MQSKLHKNEEIRRRLHNKVIELKGNIRVFCRVRPILKHETIGMRNGVGDVYKYPDKTEDARMIELCAEASSHISYRSNNKLENGSKRWKFDFDRVFGPHTTQEKMFVEVCALVQSAMDGYRVCIFAYGQTG